MPVIQRADQGVCHRAKIPSIGIESLQVQFLRTYYPDFEMSADLVREEITADVRASQMLQEFDPYQGSMLETLTCSRKAGRSLTCLAFPMGDSYLDLSKPSLYPSDALLNINTMIRCLTIGFFEKGQGQAGWRCKPTS